MIPDVTALHAAFYHIRYGQGATASPLSVADRRYGAAVVPGNATHRARPSNAAHHPRCGSKGRGRARVGLGGIAVKAEAPNVRQLQERQRRRRLAPSAFTRCPSIDISASVFFFLFSVLTPRSLFIIILCLGRQLGIAMAGRACVLARTRQTAGILCYCYGRNARVWPTGCAAKVVIFICREINFARLLIYHRELSRCNTQMAFGNRTGRPSGTRWVPAHPVCTFVRCYFRSYPGTFFSLGRVLFGGRDDVTWYADELPVYLKNFKVLNLVLERSYHLN